MEGIAGIESFLSLLWGRKDEERGLIEIMSGVWERSSETLGDLSFRHLKTAKGAAEEVERRLKSRREIYVGVSLAGEKPARGRRNSLENVVGSAGLFCDVDFGIVGHKNSGHPPDQDSAIRLIMAPGLKPTLLVHTGHGLHAWWLLEEVLYFDSPAEREHFARLESSWVETLKIHARGMGWTIDPVKDLARVLRVVGTRNYKTSDDGLEVRVLEEGPRYTDFSEFEERAIVPAREAPFLVSDLQVSERSDPPVDKLSALLENDRKFSMTWQHKRPEFGGDESKYEMALASIAVRANWTDQEIASLIIAHRRRWDPEKLSKMFAKSAPYGECAYLKRTIHAARQGSTAAWSEKEMLDRLEISGGEDDSRGARLKKLSSIFGLPILNVIKHGNTTEAQYSLQVGDGDDVFLGGIDTVDSNRMVRRVLLATKGIHVRRMKDHQWDEVVALIHVVADRVSIEESRRVFQIREWVEDHLGADEVDAEVAFLNGDPFREDGFSNVQVSGLRKHIKLRQFEDVKKSTLWGMLREAGFQCLKQSKRVKGSVVTRWYWRGKSRVVAAEGIDGENEKGAS